MKLPPLSRDQVREVDRVAIDEYSMSGLVLMENAGRGAAERIQQVAPDGKVGILCGGGNNGGDGFVIARHLERLERDVRLFLLVPPEKLRGDAEANFRIAAKAKIPMTELASVKFDSAMFSGFDVLVDCLLGTGAQGAPREPFSTAIRAANECGSARIAIDLPSGLDCDDGTIHEPVFLADHTITFVARKKGMDASDAGRCLGKIHVAGIGVPVDLLRRTRDRIGRL